MDIKNAIIKAARISNEDHGMLSIWLTLDYGSSGQGFGGYCLYNPTHKQDCAGLFIWRVLEIAGVNRWERLVGKTIRVKSNHSGIESIGNIVKDDWFNPSIELK